MQRILGWLGLMVLFVIVLPTLAADDDTDAKVKPDAKDKKQYDKLIKSGKSFIGKLVKVDGDKRVLTVEVTYVTTKQDPQTVQNLANLQLRRIEAQRNRNLSQLNQIAIDMERNTRNLYKTAT